MAPQPQARKITLNQFALPNPGVFYNIASLKPPAGTPLAPANG
jgi:hypothetical protein